MGDADRALEFPLRGREATAPTASKQARHSPPSSGRRAPRPGAPAPPAHLLRKTALANAGLADKQEQPALTGDGLTQTADELIKLMLPTDEESARSLRRRRRDSVEGGVLTEDCLVQVAQRLAGLDPESLHQRFPRVLVCGKSVRLPAAAVKREHEQFAQSFAEWMLPYQRLQLAHKVCMPCLFEVESDPQLEASDVQLV
jgi:hypothetical protein